MTLRAIANGIGLRQFRSGCGATLMSLFWDDTPAVQDLRKLASLTDVVTERVAASKIGVSAEDLAMSLKDEGHTGRQVEAAIRNALDKGAVELGPKLRLVLRPPSDSEAA